MKRPPLFFLLFLCSLLVAGCDTAALKAAPGDATRLGGELHQQIDKEQWDELYAQADPKYREAVDGPKSEALFQAIHHKLGTVTNLKMESWQIQATTSGTYLRAGFTATYSTGATSTDTLVWRKDDGTYRLVSWNINSDALILK